MTQEQSDRVIDEVRRIRQLISAGCGHDRAQLVAYDLELQERHRDRLIDWSKAPEQDGDLDPEER